MKKSQLQQIVVEMAAISQATANVNTILAGVLGADISAVQTSKSASVNQPSNLLPFVSAVPAAPRAVKVQPVSTVDGAILATAGKSDGIVRLPVSMFGGKAFVMINDKRFNAGSGNDKRGKAAVSNFGGVKGDTVQFIPNGKKGYTAVLVGANGTQSAATAKTAAKGQETAKTGKSQLSGDEFKARMAQGKTNAAANRSGGTQTSKPASGKSSKSNTSDVEPSTQADQDILKSLFTQTVRQVLANRANPNFEPRLKNYESADARAYLTKSQRKHFNSMVTGLSKGKVDVKTAGLLVGKAARLDK